MTTSVKPRGKLAPFISRKQAAETTYSFGRDRST